MNNIVPVPSLLTVGALAAAGGTFALAGYLCRHRGKPGADWLLASLTAQGAFCLLAGASLFVFAPRARLVLEALTWASLLWVGPLFLAFALAYTGGNRLLGGSAVLPVAAANSLVVATAPLHDFVLSDFRVDPTGGAATVAYTVEPLGYVTVAVGLGMAGLGVVLLVDTVLSYGPLYRREAASVALSTLPPTAGTVVWIGGTGSPSQLAFVAVTFLPHLLFDADAFVGNAMFETNPTTRRAADRTAVDDIGTPVLVLDPEGRVVDYNSAADPLLDDGGDGTTLLGTPISTLVDVGVRPRSDGGTDAVLTGEGPERGDEVLSVRSGGRRREFLVSRSKLTDPSGAVVGTTLVFQDVTRERRREQQLDVLNRVLRHNLRNKVTAISGSTQLIASNSEDERLADAASIAHDSARELVDVAEKARTFEQSHRDGPEYRRVDLGSLVAGSVADYRDRADDVWLSIGPDATAVSDPELLRLIVSNLVENAVEHCDAPTVSVTATVEDGETCVSVADDGPGIPESELAPIDAGVETPLEHTTGIGLWVVQWSVTSLGGTLSFDTDSGTTATVTLPDGPGGFDGV